MCNSNRIPALRMTPQHGLKPVVVTAAGGAPTIKRRELIVPKSVRPEHRTRREARGGAVECRVERFERIGVIRTVGVVKIVDILRCRRICREWMAPNRFHRLNRLRPGKNSARTGWVVRCSPAYSRWPTRPTVSPPGNRSSRNVDLSC
jgi:hypothetical protein